MNEKIKNILLHIICFVIGMVIGGVGTGAGVIYYSNKKIERINQYINKTNEYFADVQRKIAESKRYNSEVGKRLDASLENTARLRTLTQDSNGDIDKIIRLNQEARTIVEDLKSSK